MSALAAWLRGDLALLGEAARRFTRHGGDSLAAGVSFGMLLSIAPLLVVAVAIASVVLGEGTAREHVVDLVRESLGRPGAALVGTWVEEARTWSGTATALGLTGFLIGAARLVGIIDAAFDVVFEAPRLTLTWRESARAYLLVQVTGVLVTLVAGLIVVASVLLRALSVSALGMVEGTVSTALVGVVRTLGSLALLTLALGILYRTLPPYRLGRADVVEGALVTALLLDGAAWALSFVLSRVDVAAPYGAAGAVVAVLVWLLVASSIFLFGAEITAERAERRRRALPSVPAEGGPPGLGARPPQRV